MSESLFKSMAKVNAAIALSDVKKRLQELGIDLRAGTPNELREQLVSDIAKWKAVIEKAGLNSSRSEISWNC